MNQHEIDRAVARATGESVEFVRSLGFSLLQPGIVERDWLDHTRKRRHAALRSAGRRRPPHRVRSSA